MKIKAILFDLGGTLVKTSPIPEIFQKILQAHGVCRSTEEIEEARKITEKQTDIKMLPTLAEEFWNMWNTQILEQLEIYNCVSFLAKRITELWWHYAEVELFPDAEKTLKLFKKSGLKVGLITNGLESDLKEILSRVRLTGFFDTQIASNTVGKMKPCKEVFLRALEELNILPIEAIFVGDMIENDYKGAKDCGLKALLIDREDIVKNEDIEKIVTLTELLEQV